MSFQRTSGVITIAGHGRAHWETTINGGYDYGPLVHGAELVNTWENTGSELVVSNQGIISRNGLLPGTYSGIGVVYTADVENRGAYSTQYFVRIGLFR